MRGSSLPLCLFSLRLLVACGSSDSGSAGAGGGAGAGGSGGTPGLVGASGVTVTRLDIYQGPQRTLMQDGQPQNSDIPLVAGRPAFVRMYYATDGAYDGGPVTGRLSVAGADTIEINAGSLPGAPSEAELGSTFNFDVQGDKVTGDLEYTAEIVQGSGTDNPAAHYHGTTHVDGKQNKFRLVIVPFQYDADGSHRVPDTSDAVVQNFTNRFMSLYPVSGVEVTVHAPVPTSTTISSNGQQGWTQVGLQLYGLRNAEVGSGSDVYYYGMFNPKDSIFSYCAGACVLGVTLANNRPPDVGDPSLRLAIGVGFPATPQTPGPENTAAHEIGHAHGRNHAPCTPQNLQISSVDPQYPHPKGQLGTRGYDLSTKALLDPVVYTDIMGYCSKQFVSDYTYKALYERTQRVGLPDYLGQGVDYQVVAVDGARHATWGPVSYDAAPLLADATAVTVVLADGTERSLEGQFFAYDHLAGGWLMIPVPRGAAVSRASFVVDGTFHLAAP